MAFNVVSSSGAFWRMIFVFVLFRIFFFRRSSAVLPSACGRHTAPTHLPPGLFPFSSEKTFFVFHPPVPDRTYPVKYTRNVVSWRNTTALQVPSESLFSTDFGGWTHRHRTVVSIGPCPWPRSIADNESDTVKEPCYACKR